MVATLIKQTIFLFDQPTPTQSIKNLHVVYFSTIMSHDHTWLIKTACKIVRYNAYDTLAWMQIDYTDNFC